MKRITLKKRTPSSFFQRNELAIVKVAIFIIGFFLFVCFALWIVTPSNPEVFISNGV